MASGPLPLQGLPRPPKPSPLHTPPRRGFFLAIFDKLGRAASADIREPMKSDDPVATLRHALSHDAFQLYCQPIAALGGLVMAYPMGEILVRLREEEQAMLPPGEFLPVLEHYGLMPQLDRWVLRETLRRLAVGSRIARLCLNLSAQTLADPAFPTFVAEQLAATRLPGNCVL